MNDNLSTANRNYNSVADHYQVLSNIYSFGNIQRSKMSQLKHINSGQKVLYVGVGTGEDAVLAAKKGANVTCVDISANMILLTKQSFEQNKLEGNFICDDVMKHKLYKSYDVITANFFLNIFAEPVMVEVLNQIVSLLKSKGKVLIADFAQSQGNYLSKSIQYIYHAIANISYALQGLAPVHCVYNYPKHLERSGVRVNEIDYFNLTRFGPVAYQSIYGEKIS